MSNEQAEYELIQLWLLANEGLASEDDLQRLNRLLEDDAHARRSLIQLTRQQGWLFWNGVREPGMARAALAASQPNVEAAGVESSNGRSERVDLGRRFASAGPLAGLYARGKATLAGLRVARVPLLSYRMAALVACIVLATWSIALDDRPPHKVDRLQPVSDLRAEIVGATVCVWNGEREGAPALGHQFHEGDTLQLLEGVAELRIASMTAKAELQLEGPVAVVIGSNGISNLRYGKVAIQTSVGGSGFQVATSFGRVVALPGAEIGISTFGNSAEVHVFEGTAALESPWIVSDDGELAVRDIHAGEAVRLNQTGDASLQPSTIAADRGLFTTRLSMDANFLNVNPKYVHAIRDAKPVCYWRFEATEGNRVPNEMGDRYVGQLRGDFRWVGPSGNQALELGVAPNPGAMRVSESWDDVLSKDFSFEFWMRPSHYHLGTILGFMGPFDWKYKKNPYGIAVEVQGGWGDGARTNRVRFLHRSPLSLVTRGTSMFSDRRYATRRWQHVVAIRDGSILKLYLDGELVESGNDAMSTPPGLQLVVGQLYTDEIDRPFIGYLDELSIYDRALGEQEVQTHYRLIRSEAKPHDSI